MLTAECALVWDFLRASYHAYLVQRSDIGRQSTMNAQDLAVDDLKRSQLGSGVLKRETHRCNV